MIGIYRKSNNRSRQLTLVTVAALMLCSHSVFACAACFGNAGDSPLANGMNWGIFTLLGVVVGVLGTIASFFVFLAKKSASVAAASAAPEQSSQPTQQS